MFYFLYIYHFTIIILKIIFIHYEVIEKYILVSVSCSWQRAAETLVIS